MSEPTPEQPAAPELTLLETVARLAAEGVLRALPPAGDGQRLADVENKVAQILQALATAAGPDGNAARLAERLADVEGSLQQLHATPTGPDPRQQELIDDLRLRVATLERNNR